MKKISFQILSLLISLTPLLATANGGIDDFNQKKYDSAFRRLLPDAEAGQPAAMFYLGRIFLDGLGSAPKDTSKGQSYIAKSADKNYEPALKFLAQSAERSGNLKVALNYYERLRSNGDISVVERIAEINEQLYNKERELTSSYCTSLDNAKTLNKNYNELRYVNCILEGKMQGKSQAEGFTLLKTLAERGNDLAALQLSPYLIASRNDKNWDPVYVDNLFFKNIDNNKFIEQLKSSISKADLNFEICRFTISGSTFQQQNYRASICRLSAIKGDVKAAQFVAERHLVGYDAFVQDLKKANYFINSLDAGAPKTELKLYALQLGRNYSEHFNLLVSNTNIEIGKVNEALDFQLENLIAKANQNELTAPSEISLKAKLINEFGDCKLKTTLNNFLEKYYIKNVSLEDEDKAAIEKIRPDTNCADQVIERPRRGVVSARVMTPVITKTENQTIAVTKAQQPAPASVGTPQLQSPQSLKADFPKSLDQCDKKDAQSCLVAAEMVAAKEALREISDENARTKIIIDLLDKGAALGNNDAKYRMYDLLSPIRFPSTSELQRYRELLIEFEKMKTDSASIRLIHDSVLSFNPIGNLLQTLGGKMKQNCTQASLFNAKTSNSPIEKMYLSAILNSINCKPASQ